MAKELDKLCLGVITGPHGIRGQVKVKSFTENPKQMTAYGPLTDASGKKVYTLSVTGTAKGLLIAKIDEVKDRNEAELLKGTELFVAKDKLPETDDDEFYHADLVGLKALEEDGEEFGVVTGLFDFGAGDILEIRRWDGKSVMLPFTMEVVPTIDLDAGHILVIPPLEVSERDEEGGQKAGDDLNGGAEETDG